MWGSSLTSSILSFLFCAVEAITAPLSKEWGIPQVHRLAEEGALRFQGRDDCCHYLRGEETHAAKKGQAGEETGGE